MTAHPLHHLGFEALLTRPRCPQAHPPLGQAPANSKNGVKPVWKKGARVLLADGARARVEYVDPNMRIARVRTEDGRNVTVRHKDLRAAGG